MKKDLFIKITKNAHKLTREMKAEFPTIDYRTQYGIFFKFLYQIEKEKKKKTKNGSPIEIKIDGEIKTFSTVKECWNYLVNEKSIKTDIAKWFKNGVAKKYKDRIEYIKRIEKESTEEQPVNDEPIIEEPIVVEQPINNEATVEMQEKSFGLVFEFNDGKKIVAFKDSKQIKLYENGSMKHIEIEDIINNYNQIDINKIKELFKEEDGILEEEYISPLIGKTFGNRKIVESWIDENNGKKYIKYIYNGSLDRVVPEQYFISSYVS